MAAQVTKQCQNVGFDWTEKKINGRIIIFILLLRIILLLRNNIILPLIPSQPKNDVKIMHINVTSK